MNQRKSVYPSGVVGIYAVYDEFSSCLYNLSLDVRKFACKVVGS